MPRKLDPALKDRALRMVAEHRADYSSVTAVSKAVADQLGLGKETVRRWVVQADIDAGARPGVTSEESAEIGWVDWWNHRRLHSSIGQIPPAEHEQAYYAALNREPQPL